ncbi:putative Symplekin [Zostera marina]|uniref:Putative Symplekin n=1 Tax=Zostera marina TaxID=29655 RepID=A0A0K9Q2P7_ZOSMR|nr:putative Symplekin [Zostera marina]
MMAEDCAQKAENLLSSLRTTPTIPTKIDQLLKLKEVLLSGDTSLLQEFAPIVSQLHTDFPSPVRRLLAMTIGEMGSKHIELLPMMVPTLILFLKDESPAVARQAIITGTFLFRTVLEKIAIEGLNSPQINNAMEASWNCMLMLKDAVYHTALQPGSDGIRLLAIKFLEEMILLYTPDPSGSSNPPQVAGDGIGFNISWLRGGHPILKVGDLSTVASQSLGVLLDQLRLPQVKFLSNALIIVLINSFSSIAKKRPCFYGRILPVLLSLDPSSSMIKGVNVPGAFHALKHVFTDFLKCTHPGAAPWCARVVKALNTMKVERVLEDAVPADILGSDQHERLPLYTSEVDGGRVCKKVKVEELDDSSQEDTKKVKLTASQEIVTELLHDNSIDVHDEVPLDDGLCPGGDEDGPVQQLVGVFGALVAQGDKASDSLDILISNISSDLLAEVVIANMRHLPTACCKIEKEEESTLIRDQPIIPAVSFASDILSLSNTLSSILNAQRSIQETPVLYSEGEGRIDIMVDTTVPPSSFNLNNMIKTDTSISYSSYPKNIPQIENAPVASSFMNEMVSTENEIPGLGSTDQIDSINESKIAFHSNLELQGANQEQIIGLDSLLLESNSSESMSTCISETISTRASAIDTNEVPSTSSNLVFPTRQFILPKMVAPVVDLSDEQKNHLHKISFLRVIKSFKKISLVDSRNILFSLLACLGVQCPLEVDPWGLLQEHILSDFVNHEGHELTLHALYRLFQESEQDQDFFSSTTAASDYDKFLLTVAESLLELFPSSDKSLSRLLCEVPYLPKSVLKLLENLCCPKSNENIKKDFQGGDRVTQGLIAVWSLILHRPPNRETCLKIVLQSATHHSEEIRMKAIRLVANKLFPMSSIAQKIEDFANEMLLAAVNELFESEVTGTDDSTVGSHKDAGIEKENKTSANEISCDTVHLTSITEVQRRMSLYFALCTKKHSLLQRIFSLYDSMSNSVKQAVHGHIPILVRTTGPSGELLTIISDAPAGSQCLLIQVLHTLTDGIVPSQELVNSVRKLYDTKLKDVEILLPILSSLSKDEVYSVFSRIIDLSPEKFQAALSCILKGSAHKGSLLTPEEVLIAIHGVNPTKDGVSLKKIIHACASCFEQRLVFTQQVLANVLNQLVEQIPLPLLFMRSVIQTVAIFPALVDFVMEILSRLVNKQIWKNPQLWAGFLKCVVQTKPQSFSVLLQLPAAQLENALNRNHILKEPVREHANQPSIRSTLPRSTLVVLGLAQDQTPAAPQASQNPAPEPTNSTTTIKIESPNQESQSEAEPKNDTVDN